MEKVFVSYARADLEFVKTLEQRLRVAGVSCWVDREEIPPSEDWMAATERGIVEASLVLVILSAEALESAIVRSQIETATRLKKRIGPIVVEDVSGAAIPDDIARFNFIFARPEDSLDETVESIIEAIELDFDYLRQHTELLIRAQQWYESNREASYLLSGSYLEQATQWLLKAGDSNPQPSQLHIEFIRSSRNQLNKRRRVIVLVFAVVVLILVFSVSVLFVVGYRESAIPPITYAVFLTVLIVSNVATYSLSRGFGKVNSHTAQTME